jgi:hypothetical protein
MPCKQRLGFIKAANKICIPKITKLFLHREDIFLSYATPEDNFLPFRPECFLNFHATFLESQYKFTMALIIYNIQQKVIKS